MPLSARQAATLFAYGHIETHWMLLYQFGDLCYIGRFQQRFVVNGRIPEYQIFTNRPVKQHDVLRHVTNMAPQIRGIQLPPELFDFTSGWA